MNTVQGFFFDTFCTITAKADKTLLRKALDLCSQYERLLSRFAEDSDVWKLNNAKGSPIEVSEDTLEVLHCANSVFEASGGAFNIAVGAATKLWKFTGDTLVIPSDEELDTAAEQLRCFSLSFNGRFVAIPAGASIDLGGVAKGYICDRIADKLRDIGVENGLLNFGGNITTIGLHPEGRPWQVGLQKPDTARNEAIFATVESYNSAVVTSGVYERSFTKNGKLYHHILDPGTCRPALSDLTSVSVLSQSGMLADALATAILILGREQGATLANTFNAQVVLLAESGELTYTRGMPLILVED